MTLPAEIVPLLSCPACGSALAATGESAGAAASPGGGDALACTGAERHRYAEEDGFLTFARPDVGKYEPAYAARYAALWAFGYATLHSGSDEPLYRAASSLAAEALAAARRGGEARRPVVVDAGCGVGRMLRDCVALAPEAVVLGLDGSLAMLERAQEMVRSEAPITVDLAAYGFGTLHIPPAPGSPPCPNVHLMRADIERLPVADGVADLVLSVNTVDRLPHGPEHTLAEAHRVLRPGGALVFTDPLNWTDPSQWSRYPDAASILALVADLGFTVTTWFDDLLYHELLDARGSVEEFRTLVVAAEA